MRATRLHQCLDNPQKISTEFGHMGMYTGRLSKYYYRRFDYALEQAKLTDTDRILILGGGTGVFALSTAPLVDETHFTDLPRENPPFTTAQKLFQESGISDSNVEYTTGDATNLQYKKNSFDVVFALDVLEHIPDESAVIDEIQRVVVPGGRAVISAPIEVGLPLLVRETYRFIDGYRRHTESFSELYQGVSGSPSVDTPGKHRGYDYRGTINQLSQVFRNVSIKYCPVPQLKMLNPTAVITAIHPKQF